MLLYAGLAIGLAAVGWIGAPVVSGLGVMDLAVAGGTPGQWAAFLGLGLALTVAFAAVVGLLERRTPAAPPRPVSP